jgi:pyrrolysyl-tRNA synthetase, N-terminal region
MSVKPTLERLVKLNTVWLSRKDILHGVKKYEVIGNKIHVTTDCGEVIVVNNSRRGVAARSLRKSKHRTVCKSCNLSDERIKRFVFKTFDTSLLADDKPLPFEPGGPHSGIIEDPTKEFYLSIPGILTELGRGIGQAQRELDRYSIDVQNTILKDKELADYGLNATWYTMPEIKFNLRMEYSVTEKTIVDGTAEKIERSIGITPSNVKYAGLYEKNLTEESLISIKFKPIPPPQFTITRTEVPNLLGMTAKEAESMLQEKEIEAEFIFRIDPDTEDAETKVISQSVKPGNFLLNKNKLTISVDSRY